MKNSWFLIAIASFLSCSADVDLWNEKVYYTVINKTDEPMEVAWQSGGGKDDVLTGMSGSFTVDAFDNKTIQSSTSDCLDVISVTGVATAQKAALTNVCKTGITIKYTGDAKNRKLTLETQ